MIDRYSITASANKIHAMPPNMPGGPQSQPNANPSNPSMGSMNPMNPGGYPQAGPEQYGGQFPNTNNNGYPQQGQGQQGQYPGYPEQQPYGSQPYGSGPQQGYGYGAGAVDPNQPQQQQQPSSEGKKKSSIGRDVAIGVAIAALVLGGFLAVKFLILDKSSSDTPSTDQGSAGQQQIATIEIAMPEGITAEFFVDEKRIATVENGRKLPVTAGMRKIKLLAPNGSRCEQPIELPAGETKTIQCIMFTGSAGSASTGSGSGSAAPAVGSAGSGSAKPATGSGSAGSAAGSGSAKPEKPEKTAAEKAADRAAEKARQERIAAERAEKAEKAAAEKAAADKAAALAAAEKIRLEKLKAGSGSTARPPDPNAKGFLTVTSKPPGAKVAIDNVDTGQVTPITRGIALSPGRHKVTFTLGSDRHTFTVNITAGKTEPLNKELK